MISLMRGEGRIFKRAGTPFWWIAYYDKGKERRFSTYTTDENEAIKVLQEKKKTPVGLPKKDKRQEYIYLIKCGDFVKIGRAVNVEERLKALQCANPHKLELLATQLGSSAEEAGLHNIFWKDHHMNEWFVLSPQIKEYFKLNAA